jgi:acetyltransferase-like isoleucine patch superfamily enzyme
MFDTKQIKKFFSQQRKETHNPQIYGMTFEKKNLTSINKNNISNNEKIFSQQRKETKIPQYHGMNVGKKNLSSLNENNILINENNISINQNIVLNNENIDNTFQCKKIFSQQRKESNYPRTYGIKFEKKSLSIFDFDDNIVNNKMNTN